MNIEKLILEHLYENTFKYNDFYVSLENFFKLNHSIKENNPNLSFTLEKLRKRKYINIDTQNNEKSIALSLEGLLYYEDTFLTRKERVFKKLVEKILIIVEKVEEGRIEKEFSLEKFLEILNLEINPLNRKKILLDNSIR